MPARDPEKALSQQLILGGAPQAKRSRTSTLVVCGTTRPCDGWIFSDFLGFSKAFETFGGDNTFYSCLDLTKHFQWLKGKGQANIDIKFGKYGPDGDHTLIYERSQFEQCPPFWKQIVPDRLLYEAEFWIGKAKRTSENGDIVNCIFLCHESERGELELGSRMLSSTALYEKLGGFKEGVQVNVMTRLSFRTYL
ncbi:uncharacterized protein N7483_007796 [Penicillium malachiteum]|uniref:uncharacterized protein n=1 Tax=Penicillium malachiteum TaxID=1324776 RepID=UPI0025479077|nr:uncharacterized protein N7483_007796 [Penicillium malachiteum]KAJ5726439.1 hypothetical protein N7483_007796 [Penicillium malachiteum]